MRIYKCSMEFRIPAVDQSHWSIQYNYDLIWSRTVWHADPVYYYYTLQVGCHKETDSAHLVVE